MMMQISAGQGPEECEFAVAKLYDALCKEYPNIELLEKAPGRQTGCYKSIRFCGDSKMRILDGSIQWICQSPFRPKHKRKNWFVDVSIGASADSIPFHESFIRFETFRSSGKGGQHVNKTESGIRAIYTPTGDSVIATDERSQQMNKKIAIERLKQLIGERNQAGQSNAKNQNWLENYKIERGNPVRIYEGMSFILRK
ncbi:peptide chain release factor H [Lachnospiraceae bacterium ZAX-1]